MASRCRVYHYPLHKRVALRRSLKERLCPYPDNIPRPSSLAVIVSEKQVHDPSFRVWHVRYVIPVWCRLLRVLGSCAKTGREIFGLVPAEVSDGHIWGHRSQCKSLGMMNMRVEVAAANSRA